MNELEILNAEDLIEAASIEEMRQKNKFDTYEYNGVAVPRVSMILQECISKEFLVNWAGRIGLKNMAIERKKATSIGTVVHEMIGYFLQTGKVLDINSMLPYSYRKYAERAFFNFRAWLKYLNNNGYDLSEIIAIEKSVSCPWYGGTIDCIAMINGKIYILDFKTSKSISYEYIIQVCAYMWIINHGYCKDIKHVDGVGIIRVDKETSNKFNDYFLNSHIPEQNRVIENFYAGFGALLNSYYNIINMRYLFGEYKKGYDITSVLDDNLLSIEEK